MTTPSDRASGHLEDGDKASDAVLGVVLQSSDDAILTLDAAGDVTLWSGTAERLFGQSAGLALGAPFAGLFPVHLRMEVRSLIERALSGERITHFESEFVRSDDLPVQVWLTVSPVPHTSREQARLVVIVRDITEQNLAQAALAEVDKRLQEGEALSHVGSWLWDLRTGAVQWSAEFHRIHGVDPFDFDGTFQSHLKMIHPEDRDEVRSMMERSVASSLPFEHEYTIVRPDGDPRLLHVRAQPSIGSTGAAFGLRGIGQDVTDRAVPAVSRDRPGS